MSERTISTREELDSLPDKSIIRTRGQITFEKYDGWFRKGEDGWQRPGYEWTERTSALVDPVHLPIAVLYEPQP